MNDRELPPSDNLIAGRNPVMAALKAGREIDAVYVAAGDRTGSIVRIIAMAREQRIPVKEVAAIKLDHMVSTPHQGVVASAASIDYTDLDGLFAVAAALNEPPFFVISDEIEDPHNLGAIIRTAEAAGAHGLILPKRRGVQVTPAVLKAAAGAAERLRIAKADNLAATVDELKERGVWVYGADMTGSTWCQSDLTGAAALVVGSEGRGLGRLLASKCDVLLSLPMRGDSGSLNASVAAGILLYEFARQRNGIRAK